MKLQGASLDGAQLQGASLNVAQLQGASLDGAQLQGASLNVAQLQGASLDGAQLQGASLDRAQLQGASLDRANFDATVLFTVALKGSEGLAGSAVATMVFDLDETPLDTQRSVGIIDAVRHFLRGSEDRLADFERRIKQASQSDGGMVRFGTHGCYGSEKLGCPMGDVSERFINEKYLPVLVNLVCNGDLGGFTVEAGKVVLRRLVVEEIGWKMAAWPGNPVVDRLRKYNPIFYLASRLLEALDAKRCPAVESMSEELKDRLRKAAAFAEQFRLLELRMLPDP